MESARLIDKMLFTSYDSTAMINTLCWTCN